MHKVLKNKETNKFEVIEIATNLVIFEDEDHGKSHAYYRFVKRGGAFNGFTPSFIMRKADVETSFIS